MIASIAECEARARELELLAIENARKLKLLASQMASKLLAIMRKIPHSMTEEEATRALEKEVRGIMPEGAMLETAEGQPKRFTHFLSVLVPPLICHCKMSSDSLPAKIMAMCEIMAVTPEKYCCGPAVRRIAKILWMTCMETADKGELEGGVAPMETADKGSGEGGVAPMETADKGSGEGGVAPMETADKGSGEGGVAPMETADKDKLEGGATPMVRCNAFSPRVRRPAPKPLLAPFGNARVSLPGPKATVSVPASFGKGRMSLYKTKATAEAVAPPPRKRRAPYVPSPNDVVMDLITSSDEEDPRAGSSAQAAQAAAKEAAQEAAVVAARARIALRIAQPSWHFRILPTDAEVAQAAAQAAKDAAKIAQAAKDAAEIAQAAAQAAKDAAEIAQAAAQAAKDAAEIAQAAKDAEIAQAAKDAEIAQAAKDAEIAQDAKVAIFYINLSTELMNKYIYDEPTRLARTKDILGAVLTVRGSDVSHGNFRGIMRRLKYFADSSVIPPIKSISDYLLGWKGYVFSIGQIKDIAEFLVTECIHDEDGAGTDDDSC